MSTNSAIIAPCVGGFRGIYCHWDGYPKGGVGETLFRHYTDSDKVNQLLDLGDISSLGDDGMIHYGVAANDSDCTGDGTIHISEISTN